MIYEPLDFNFVQSGHVLTKQEICSYSWTSELYLIIELTFGRVSSKRITKVQESHQANFKLGVSIGIFSQIGHTLVKWQCS